MTTYKAMTSVYKGSNFQTTVPVLENSDEALAYAEQCADRAPYIVDYKVVTSDKEVTHKFRDGKLIRLKELVY